MSEKSFSKFGKAFQEKVFQGMLSDPQWAAQMIEVMQPEYFDLKYLSFLCEKHFKYYQKYKTFSTLTMLITIIKEDLSNSKDVILRDQIIEYLKRIKTNPDMWSGRQLFSMVLPKGLNLNMKKYQV